jgi:hypothetical protein
VQRGGIAVFHLRHLGAGDHTAEVE